jgi:hypothetical protein
MTMIFVTIYALEIVEFLGKQMGEVFHTLCVINLAGIFFT